MSKTLILCGALVFITSACSNESPYCCALKNMAGNVDYTAEARSTWQKFADGENEEVCKTEVESGLAHNSDFEIALAECADK